MATGGLYEVRYGCVYFAFTGVDGFSAVALDRNWMLAASQPILAQRLKRLRKKMG